MTYWNHRVVRKRHSNGHVELAIHEVYYDKDESSVSSLTVNSVSPHVQENIGENIEDLKVVLNQMLRACDKPILDYDEI